MVCLEFEYIYLILKCAAQCLRGAVPSGRRNDSSVERGPGEQAPKTRGDGPRVLIYINCRGIGYTKHNLFVDFHHCSATGSLMKPSPRITSSTYWGNGAAFMLTIGREGPPSIGAKGSSDIRTVAFTADGEHYIVGGGGEVGVWRVKDGKQMATLPARHVNCLAASKDGRWIATGTEIDYAAIVWDAKTFEQVARHIEVTFGVDFSPDSTRLVVVSSDRTATVFDVATRKRVLAVLHKDTVRAAKYSPQGDRIATATRESVRVWDSNEGRFLVHIPVTVTPYYNTGLLWSNNHLFVISESTIKEFEASTGSAVSEWPVASGDHLSCITLAQHGKIIAYAANDSVTVWDTSTHTQLGSIQHPQGISSIALSPDSRFLAICEHGGEITTRSLSWITVSIYRVPYPGSELLSCSARLSK
jgi:WD40 repeat protein